MPCRGKCLLVFPQCRRRRSLCCLHFFFFFEWNQATLWTVAVFGTVWRSLPQLLCCCSRWLPLAVLPPFCKASKKRNKGKWCRWTVPVGTGLQLEPVIIFPLSSIAVLSQDRSLPTVSKVPARHRGGADVGSLISTWAAGCMTCMRQSFFSCVAAKESGSRNIIMQNGEDTTGATWLQFFFFCRGSRKKEGNLSVPTALRLGNLKTHAAAW